MYQKTLIHDEFKALVGFKEETDYDLGKQTSGKLQ